MLIRLTFSEHRLLGPPQSFWFRGWSWGLKICISNKLPGNADTFDLGTTLWETMTYINSFKTYKNTVWYYILQSLRWRNWGSERSPRTQESLDQNSCYNYWAQGLLLRSPSQFQRSMFPCLQTIKPRHPRKSHSSSEKSQENPEHAQLLPVVSEWAPNPRVALGGRAMDYRAAWPEQGSPRGCRLIKAPLQLPWTFLFLLLQFIWHSLGLLIHSHLGGKKKKKWKWTFFNVDFSFKFMTMWCPQEWLFSSLSP